MRIPRISLVFLLMVAVSLACLSTPDSAGPTIESDETTEKTNAPVNGDTAAPVEQSDPVGDPSADLDCERKGYPCTYAEVDPDVLAQADALLSEAAQMIGENRSTSETAAYLESLEEVAEVLYDEFTLVFRVKNAPPMVVFHPDAEPDYDAPSAQAAGSGVMARPVAVQFSGDDGPVGLQTDGENPKKRALILSLYLWQFINDEGDEIAALLRQNEDYDCEGCVEYIEITDNPKERMSGNLTVGPGIENFLGWNQYDLIHLATHGRQICPDDVESGCMSLIQTGRYIGGFSSAFEDTEYLSYNGLLYGASANLPEGWRFELVSSDFFRSTYPGGLSDTMIFFSACQSMKSPDLADSLIGENTAVLGWSETVNNNPATEISVKFYENAVSNGLRAKVAYDKTKSFGGYTYGFERANADLLIKGSPEPRGREVITLLHPFYRTELKENSPATSQGTAGDGENDTLWLAIQIEGVDESQDPSEFPIRIKINQQDTGQTFTADRSAGEYKYQTGLISVPLPFDVDNEQTVTIEAWADLPEGGQTRQVIEQVLPAGCGWNGLMNGTDPLEGNEVLVINHPKFTVEDEARLFQELGYGDAEQYAPAGLLAFILGSETNNGFPNGVATAQGGSLGLGPMDIYGAPSLDLAYTDFESSLYGTVSGSYLGISGTISFSGEFFWHTDSRCSIAIKMAAIDSQ